MKKSALVVMLGASLLSGCISPSTATERSFSKDEIYFLDATWLARHYAQYQSPELMAEMLERKLLTEYDQKLINSRRIEIGMSEIAFIAIRGFPEKPEGWRDEMILQGNHRRITYHYKDATYWFSDGVLKLVNIHH